ncbi:MAG TPA: M1 family aminopeptidase, partial [Sphingobacteriaceae bacterium]
INALAGHELSHQWWGTSRLDPEYKEGGWLLTETLAKYTELMLYEKSHGKDALRELIRYHLDTYLSLRSYSRETPLVKTTFETPHLPYNKGFVVMYQLKELIGEQAVNRALKSLLARHGFPKPPADANDLLAEFHRVSPESAHPVIDELFCKIILFDGRIGRADDRVVPGGHEVVFAGTMQKFQEDGRGNRRHLDFTGLVEVGVYDVLGKLTVRSLPVIKGNVSGTIALREKPVRIVMDPSYQRIDAFPADNERVVALAGRPW